MPYTLQYDETTNKQVQKQLDISVRYWSPTANEVAVHHLTTYLMGHATGDHISKKILKSVTDNDLALNLLLALGSDGPNINKTVWRKVNEEVMKTTGCGQNGMLDIGTCSLHIAHNSFSKGLESYGGGVSDFVIDIHQWFKLSAARREDFAKLQESKGVHKVGFMKHVECRWLSLEPAITRIIEQYDVLKQHFLTDLPKESDSVCRNARYQRIKNYLITKETLVQMHFLKSVCAVFTPFLTIFQRREPLIHLLYDEWTSLLLRIMGRFIKAETIAQKTGKQLTEVNVELVENQLADPDHKQRHL